MLQSQIVGRVGLSKSTVSRGFARAGLSKLSELKPTEPVQHHGHYAPDDMLHTDTKKLGRMARPCPRFSFTAMQPDTGTLPSGC